MNTDDYFDPEDTVGFLIWDANRAMNREFSERIARHGVSLGLWPFLRALWEGDGLTQRELSEKVRMKLHSDNGSVLVAQRTNATVA